MVLAIYRGRPLWVDSTQVVPANQPYPATCPGACVCVLCTAAVLQPDRCRMRARTRVQKGWWLGRLCVLISSTLLCMLLASEQAEMAPSRMVYPICV